MSRELLERLKTGLPEFTPELNKAAVYILENPNAVSVSSIREIASAARVKPNSLVRLARSIGLDGYDEFRGRFRDQVRQGTNNFPDRARWLQSLSRDGELGDLYANMAANAISNIERTFGATDADKIKAAADAIVNARNTWVLGVGINHALAQNFAYLADMALDNIQAIPRGGSLAVDDLARAGADDLLLAMTFKPYRNEVVDAVRIAQTQKTTIIGISDSPASPIVAGSEHSFVVQTDTAQFFTSTFATGALLETLMAFVIADAGDEVIANIHSFHERRHQLGIYYTDNGA